MHIGSVGAGPNQTVRPNLRLVPPSQDAIPSEPQQASVSDATQQAAVARSSYVHVPTQFFATSSVPQAGAGAARTIDKDVENAHQTAWSALHNERFRHALEQLSDAHTSDAVMMLREEGSGTDIGSARARYAENSE